MSSKRTPLAPLSAARVNAEPQYVKPIDLNYRKNLVSVRNDCNTMPFSSEFFASESRSMLSRMLPASRARNARARAMNSDVRAMNAEADAWSRNTGEPRRSPLATKTPLKKVGRALENGSAQPPSLSALGSSTGTDVSEKIFSRIGDGAWIRPPSEHDDDDSSCASDEHDDQTPIKPKQLVLTPLTTTSSHDDSSEPRVSSPKSSRFKHRGYSYYWAIPPPPSPGSTTPLPSARLEACLSIGGGGAHCERAAGLRLASFTGDGSPKSVSWASTPVCSQLAWLHREMALKEADGEPAEAEAAFEKDAAPHPCSLLSTNAPWRRPAAKLSPLGMRRAELHAEPEDDEVAQAIGAMAQAVAMDHAMGMRAGAHMEAAAGAAARAAVAAEAAAKSAEAAAQVAAAEAAEAEAVAAAAAKAKVDAVGNAADAVAAVAAATAEAEAAEAEAAAAAEAVEAAAVEAAREEVAYGITSAARERITKARVSTTPTVPAAEALAHFQEAQLRARTEELRARYMGMKLADLRTALEALSLDAEGPKPVLIGRLLDVAGLTMGEVC